MKKMILYALGALFATTFTQSGFAKSASAHESYKELMKLSQSQKDSWFQFMADEVVDKINLMKKQHDEWFAFKSKELDRLGKLASLDERDSFLKKSFDEALALRKKHGAEWKTHCEARHKKAQEMHMKDAAALRKLSGEEEEEAKEMKGSKAGASHAKKEMAPAQKSAPQTMAAASDENEDGDDNE